MSSQELIGIKCRNCSTKTFPRRVFCPNCRGRDLEEWNVPSKGVIYSYTTVHFPIDRYEEAPYYVGLISVENDLKPLITAQISFKDLNHLQIGQIVNLKVNKNFGPYDRTIVIASIVD